MSTTIETNRYYKLATIGEDTVSAAETLLNQYPLTLREAHDMGPDKKLEFALEVLQLIGAYVVMQTDEACDYQKRLKKISLVNTEFDIKEIQARFIFESIEKLQKTLFDKKLRKDDHDRYQSEVEELTAGEQFQTAS